MNLKNQNGSALISALSIIVILTLLVGTVLLTERMQHHFIQRDVQRLQALYAAEAGVYNAMQHLRNNPFWEVSDTILTLFDGIPSKVSVEIVGGYYQIRSTAIKKRQRVTVRATIAEKAPAAFDTAVYLWDRVSRLNVAGSTIIHGDIQVGQRGVRQNTLAGIRYTGELLGVSHYNPNIKPPFFDDRHLQQSIERLDQIILASSGGQVLQHASGDLESSVLLPGEFPLYFFEGDLVISQADSLLLKSPHIIVASGNLSLDGPLKFAAGTQFLAWNEIRLQGVLEGENGLFYGRQALVTEGVTSCKGQFFSRQKIIIKDQTYLTFPSLLFLGGIDGLHTEKIEVRDYARIDGTVIHGYLAEEPEEVRGRIIVEENAVVRGGIFNAYETELHGTVYGSVLTHQFFFYKSPTRYVNWLMDATIDTELRPNDLHVPLMFSPEPDLKVISWDISQRVLPFNELQEVKL